MSKANVSIITGYLGSGKTTLINHLLSQPHGRRYAVIVNEFGDLGIDGDLIVNTEEAIIELTNGCLCCSVRGDLIAGLGSLRPRLDQIDGVIVETSGLADPAPVAQTFLVGEDEPRNYELDAVITLVDARHGLALLEHECESVSQVAFADRLLLTKPDLATPADLAKLRDRLRRINPHAAVTEALNGAVPHEALTGLGAFDVARLNIESGHSVPHRHDDQVQSLSLTADRPIDPDRFMQWMQRLIVVDGMKILRTKGVMDFTGETRRFVFQGVQTVLDGDAQGAWPEGPRQSRMVIIGRGLDHALLRADWEGLKAR